MDPRGGDCRTQARYFATLAVLSGETLTGQQEELARAVLEVVLLAGLPPPPVACLAARDAFTGEHLSVRSSANQITGLAVH